MPRHPRMELLSLLADGGRGRRRRLRLRRAAGRRPRDRGRRRVGARHGGRPGHGGFRGDLALGDRDRSRTGAGHRRRCIAPCVAPEGDAASSRSSTADWRSPPASCAGPARATPFRSFGERWAGSRSSVTGRCRSVSRETAQSVSRRGPPGAGRLAGRLHRRVWSRRWAGTARRSATIGCASAIASGGIADRGPRPDPRGLSRPPRRRDADRRPLARRRPARRHGCRRRRARRIRA